MALTQDDIQAELIARNFPDILTSTDLSGIIKATLRHFNEYGPFIQYSSFTPLAKVQDYFIFDPTDSVTNGFAQNALQILNVYWNPGGDWTSLNLFSPGWYMLAQVVLYTGSYFHEPSMMMVLRQKLDAWKQQFGSQGFDIIGPIGKATSFLRVYPIPQADSVSLGSNAILVEYTLGTALADLTSQQEYEFWFWMEYYAADAIANLYSITAGTTILGFEDSPKTMDYWRKRADFFYDRNLKLFGGIHGQVERT